jgi:predicted permease
MSWVKRSANLFRRQRVSSEVEAELQFHIEARVRENLAAGMTPAEARQAALRRFGGELAAADKTRDADLVVWLETLAQDIRGGFRNLVMNRGVTVVAVLSLALGIGANTAIFSAIHAVLLRPLPYRDPARLAMLWNDNRRLGVHEDLSSYANFLDWKNNRMFEDMAGFVPSDTILTGFEEPVQLADALIDPNFFAVLGTPPLLGRAFTAEEMVPGNEGVAIMSHTMWQRQFAADSHVLGKVIELDGKPCKVVGVMPAGFAFPSKETQFWKPLPLSPQQRSGRGLYFLHVVARLKPGVTMVQARAEMATLGARLEQQYPANKGYGIWVVPLLDQVVGTMRQVLLVLLGAVAFVLLIACVNVANLFLGRGAARGREIAVRAALGAGRARLVRQLLTESAVLSLIAGVLGLALAYWGIKGLVMLAPKDLPRLDEVAVDGTVLAFTLAVSLIAGVLFGAAPALRVSRVELNDALREGGRGQSGGKRLRLVRSRLTVLEVAFSMILLTGAGLMIRSLLSLQRIHPGFRTENMLTWRIAPSRTKYPPGSGTAPIFYQDILSRIQSLPGVEGAEAITDLFLTATPNSGEFTVEGRPDPPPEQRIEATLDSISPGYFQTMGVPLIRGRFFNGRDGKDTLPVVLINETMARRFWPNEDAVGKHFKFGGPGWLTVAGVVGDMRRQGMDKQARCETFLPMTQRPSRGMTVVVRTLPDPVKLVGTVREAVRAVDASAVMFERSTIADQIGDSLAQRRFQTLLLGLFSGLALALAAVGIYGVVYQSVAQRSNEMGIRLALGAGQDGLLAMIVREALTPVLIGALAGGAAAYATSRALAGFLFGVTPSDPLTYLVVILVLVSAAALASLIPARRAARVDPVHVLRYE